MYKKNLGDQIKDIVQDAVDSCNFGDLNRKIKNTADRAIDEFNRATEPFQYNNRRNRNNVPPFMGQGPYTNGRQGQPFTNRAEYERQRREQRQQYRAQRHQFKEQRREFREKWNGPNNPYNPRPQGSTMQSKYQEKNKAVGNVSGILFIVFGSIGMGLFGIAAFVLLTVWLATGGGANAVSVVGTSCGVLTAGFVSMLAIGVHKRRRVKRFHIYQSLLGQKNYCEIARLAQYVGKSNHYVVKDLRKMMLLGFFKEGHIDESQTCFISDNDTYEQYKIAQESYKERIKEESKQKETKNKELDPELKKAMEDGKEFIRQLKAANEDIPGQEISSKLYRLEDIISKIFVCVEKHPEKLPEIRKFMEYYLPITLKLVNAYKEFEAQPIQGENIKNSKAEIEATIDTINEAFEKLLDSLYEEEAMEVSSDISVLNTLFAQEGLTKKDFDLK